MAGRDKSGERKRLRPGSDGDTEEENCLLHKLNKVQGQLDTLLEAVSRLTGTVNTVLERAEKIEERTEKIEEKMAEINELL